MNPYLSSSLSDSSEDDSDEDPDSSDSSELEGDLFRRFCCFCFCKLKGDQNEMCVTGKSR